MNDVIPFNVPCITGKEGTYLQEVLSYGKFSGDGPFTKSCHALLEKMTGTRKALLTHSCTAALEMAAILADIQPGDEVIMPSYTFVSTANAFVLRGGIPVFVDIRPDTLNIDETLIEAVITKKTKAIVPVHYAGVGCEMDVIMDIARRHNLFVIEDAAQGVGARYKGQALGSIGHMGCYSFHETKNIQCGEGGALLINDDQFIERAEIIREKGTNRSRFLRGQVDKYTWVDIGSSYLPSELNAAFLFAQLEEIEVISNKRIAVWEKYHQAFEVLESLGVIKRPFIPSHCDHNAHIYYLICRNEEVRNLILSEARERNIITVSHYIPLHRTQEGMRSGKFSGRMEYTEKLSGCILRLPMYANIFSKDIHLVVETLNNIISIVENTDSC